MSPLILLLPILLPILMGFIVYRSQALLNDILRYVIIFLSVLLNSVIVWVLILKCSTDSVVLFTFANNLTITFCFDGLGRFFAGIVATLWPITTLFAFEYMRHSAHKLSFYAFFLISYGVTVGICTAGNMLTLFCFYEQLTLATLPLVINSLSRPALRAGRTYLVFSIGGAAFAFLGLVFLITFGNTDRFVYGGILGTFTGSRTLYSIIYIFAFLGFGVKAAVFPLHVWLPKASIAPTPVTALLHAVAVVKAGVFAIIRLTYFSFDPKLLTGTFAQHFVMTVAILTILYGSTMALKQGHWKRRLAYSTISNLSYILFGVTMMTVAGLTAALTHMVFHAIIKILAFLCIGSVMHNSKCEYVYQLDGLGYKMPITFSCFTFAAVSLIGIPPFNGFFSKWELLTAAAAAGESSLLPILGAGVLLISALLTAIYMLTPVIRAFFYPPAKICQAHESNAYMTAPMTILAVAVLVTGLFASTFIDIASKIAHGML